MAADPRRIKELFVAALELPQTARAAFLVAKCHDDEEIRHRVSELLRAHDAPAPVLQRPLAEIIPVEPGDARLAADAADSLESAGSLIGGRYRLLELIGEGGMGAVWKARQTEPVQREVAVKLIKAGKSSKHALARFDAERQALALMDHPNIAKVLDGGATQTGLPYFVMELVHGVPITKYCDEHRLTPRERLELFVPVCQAIQHAHQKGIIHRDIKPSNVLVALFDDRPVPKVIDFGIAKAVGQQLTEHTLQTWFGSVVGTIEYMSPEQASFERLDVDTRSDIYSLGVLLYELLTGSPPFPASDLEDAGMLKILRIIRDEEPARPSVKLSTAVGLPALAATRNTEPAKLSRLIRGELDWIVMKALEKDRNRRYETATGLALDVQRYLRNEAVQACPPSATYRMRKFVRRNRGSVLAASLVMLAVSSGAVGTTLGLVRAERSRQDEIRARQAAESERDQKEVARLRAVANLKKASEAVDRMLTRVAEERLLHVPQMEPLRRRLLHDALSLFDDLMENGNDDVDVRADTALACAHLGKICRLLGAFVEAEQRLRRAIVMLREVAAESPNEIRLRIERIECQRQLGWVLVVEGRRKEAETVQRQALLDAEQLADDSGVGRNEVADCCVNLAATVHVARPEEAAELCRRVIQLAEHVSVHRTTLAQVHLCRGELLQRANQQRAAETAYRNALAIYDTLVREAPNTSSHRLCRAGTQACLASVLSSSRQFAPAEQAYREAIAVAQKFASDSPRVPYYTDSLTSWRMGLAGVLRASGRFHDAEAEYRSVMALLDLLTDEFPDALELREKLPLGDQQSDVLLVASRGSPGPAGRRADPVPQRLAESEGANLSHHARRAQALLELGSLLGEIGRPAEAGACIKSALDVFETLAVQLLAKPEHQVSLAHTLACAAIRFQSAGRHADAAEVCRRALGQFAQLVAKDPANRHYLEWLAGEQFRLGGILALADQSEDAAKSYRQAEAIYAKLAGEGSDRHDFLFAQASTQHNLAVQQLCRKCTEDAVSGFRKSLELYAQLPDDIRKKPSYRQNVANTSNNLAWVLATTTDAKTRNVADAVANARQAVELAPNIGPYWNTLGVAQYRAGDAKAAAAAIEKSMALRQGGDGFDWIFLAMIHRRLNENEKARAWFDKAVDWADRHEPKNEELLQFRAEARDLLGIKSMRN